MIFDSGHIIKDSIWVFQERENSINAKLKQAIGNRDISFRLVDSLFLGNLEAWQAPAVVTDNIPLRPFQGQLISVLPEFWHISSYQPTYQNHPPTWTYNCFMNRISADRSRVFYELMRRDILAQGLVSFNCALGSHGQSESLEQKLVNYQHVFEQAELYTNYQQEHVTAVVPYNNVIGYTNLESAVIDSRISLVIETYISDDHITFSEKIFRSLQLPRPWVLFCSPGSVKWLASYGFDTLSDYVDHGYDQIFTHWARMDSILDQLESFVDKQYTDTDYKRFEQAADHNRQLLQLWEQQWPEKLQSVIDQIENI
jgi:hypothetical protein